MNSPPLLFKTSIIDFCIFYLEKVISIYPFKAQHDDELSFEENEIIKVIAKDDPTWWKGQSMSTGLTGLFPCNHVEPYKECKLSHFIITFLVRLLIGSFLFQFNTFIAFIRITIINIQFHNLFRH